VLLPVYPPSGAGLTAYAFGIDKRLEQSAEQQKMKRLRAAFARLRRGKQSEAAIANLFLDWINEFMDGFFLSTRQGSVASPAPLKRAEEIGGHPLSGPIQVSYGVDPTQGVDGLASKNVAGISRV
jgi:hypothetical protein